VLACCVAAVLLPPAGDSTGKYSGVVDCFVKTARNDGLLVSGRGAVRAWQRAC
jgi:hypothetical protein